MRYICFVLLAVVVTAQDGKTKMCPCSFSARCPKKIELGIVLDVSNSIWSEHLKKATEFLNNFLEYFTVNQDETRVALVPYGGQVYKDRLAFSLVNFDNIKDVQNEISAVFQPRDQIPTTVTAEAIAYMRDEQLNSQRTRSDVRRACIVLTDGESVDPDQTKLEAQKARDEGIHMFAVGVGAKVNRAELLGIAGEQNPTHVKMVDTFDELVDVIGPLVKETCSGK